MSCKVQLAILLIIVHVAVSRRLCPCRRCAIPSAYARADVRISHKVDACSQNLPPPQEISFSALPRMPVAHRRGWRGWMATARDPRWVAEVVTRRTSSQACGKASGCWTKVSRADEPNLSRQAMRQTRLDALAGDVAPSGCLHLGWTKASVTFPARGTSVLWGVAAACRGDIASAPLCHICGTLEASFGCFVPVNRRVQTS